MNIYIHKDFKLDTERKKNTLKVKTNDVPRLSYFYLFTWRELIHLNEKLYGKLTGRKVYFQIYERQSWQATSYSEWMCIGE